MAKRSKALVAGTSHFDAWVRVPCLLSNDVTNLKFLPAKNQFENKTQRTFYCMDYTGRMLEESKVQVLGSSHFNGVGSNPKSIMITPLQMNNFICQKTIRK